MKLFWLFICCAAFDLGLSIFFASIGGWISAAGLIPFGALALYFAFRARRMNS